MDTALVLIAILLWTWMSGLYYLKVSLQERRRRQVLYKTFLRTGTAKGRLREVRTQDAP
ncbi:hypothetical protein D3C77_210260 [compost metagenome]|jgi:hypothetical protein